MADLKDKKCVPCEGGVEPFGEAEAQKYLAEIDGAWRMADGGKKIKRDFKFKDFKEAMAFVNQIADIAELEGHHPDLEIHYSRVEVELSTHAIGGLSENDFILAAKIDEIKK